jgi:hypothetical protein
MLALSPFQDQGLPLVATFVSFASQEVSRRHRIRVIQAFFWKHSLDHEILRNLCDRHFSGRFPLLQSLATS